MVGALLTSSPLRQLLPVLNWTPIRLAGGLLYNSMMVIVNNLSIFLCVGIAAARTRTEKQEAALLALMAYLVFLTANHTTLEILGRLAESDGHGSDEHPGHPGHGHRRDGRHPAGFCCCEDL